MTTDVTPYLGAYLVLVALMLGSFVNLAADRLPRGESVIRPRSHCRTCGRELNAIDLLPVVGYVIRRGRCASCKAPIALRAPLVEAISGGSMVGALIWWGLWPGAVVGFAVVALWGSLIVGRALRLKPTTQSGS